MGRCYRAGLPASRTTPADWGLARRTDLRRDAVLGLSARYSIGKERSARSPLAGTAFPSACGEYPRSALIRQRLIEIQVRLVILVRTRPVNRQHAVAIVEPIMQHGFEAMQSSC